MSVVRLAGAGEPLCRTRFYGKITLHFLAPDFRKKVALAAAKAGMVKGARVGTLAALELVEVELALEGGELRVCVELERGGGTKVFC